MQLSGSITALATPFTVSGELDVSAWQRLLDAQLEAGIQGLVVAGSTGEAAMLTQAEFTQMLKAAVGAAAGRVPVLAGAGLSSTARAIEQCQRARDAGADAVLVATPAYVRPTQEGLRRHFEAIADAADVPVVLYNVPSRTGVDMLPVTTAALVTHPNIIGIKEAVPDRQRMSDLLAVRMPGFVVLSGDDGSACGAMLAGADGVVSVVANVVPAAFRRLCDLALGGNAAAAQVLDGELLPLYLAMALEPNPTPVKALMAELGLCQDSLRLPLLPLSSRFRTGLAAMADHVRSAEARFPLGSAA